MEKRIRARVMVRFPYPDRQQHGLGVRGLWFTLKHIDSNSPIMIIARKTG